MRYQGSHVKKEKRWNSRKRAQRTQRRKGLEGMTRHLEVLQRSKYSWPLSERKSLGNNATLGNSREPPVFQVYRSHSHCELITSSFGMCQSDSPPISLFLRSLCSFAAISPFRIIIRAALLSGRCGWRGRRGGNKRSAQ